MIYSDIFFSPGTSLVRPSDRIRNTFLLEVVPLKVKSQAHPVPNDLMNHGVKTFMADWNHIICLINKRGLGRGIMKWVRWEGGVGHLELQGHISNGKHKEIKVSVVSAFQGGGWNIHEDKRWYVGCRLV